MPWFKVDDSFESHPKVKAIPRPRRVKAIGLWTLAGSWSARQLTDGFVPSYMLDELAGTKTEANTLVEVDLWSAVDGGYVFKDWHDWQPTKAKVEADREAAKERMRTARERKKGPRSVDVRANDSATPPNGSGEVRSTPGSVTPTRPDPTRPDPSTDVDVLPASADAEPRAKRVKRATSRPADFRPSQAHIDLAAERGVDLRSEWANFCDWTDANGKTYKDWPAALRTWIRRARPTQAGGGQPTRAQQHLALAQRLAAEEQQVIPFRQIGGDR